MSNRHGESSATTFMEMIDLNMNPFRSFCIRICGFGVLAALHFIAQPPRARAQESPAPIVSWEFENGADGCREIRDVQLRAENGVLQVTGIGKDPHFIGPATGGHAGWKKLVIRGKANRRLSGQIFWTTQAEPRTSEANSVQFRASKSGDWFEESIYFQTNSPLRQIRFDPHDGPVRLEIDWVRIYESGPPPADPATDPAGFKILPGFQVDLLYSVPMVSQGSWVSMCVDPQGRLIVCDQYGSLYRVTLNAADQPGVKEVEKLDVNIGSAHGLLYAFDSLYVMVNRGEQSGLYRVTASAGDDRFDTVTLLQKLGGSLGEHGPHAIRLSPNGESLYVVAGNNTVLPDTVSSFRLPKHWDEDQLLLRDPCSNGHNTGRLAPGGWICRVSPDGSQWELMAAGFRNPYDIAFNRQGELFTYDADMEMDVGTPWYRPTRVCHVVSGGEYGWRWGTGKWPVWSPDSLPAAADIGLGSPTGVAFGYGADFPTKYQEALYVCDWTFGRLFAVHLKEKGASYEGQLEEFISGTPLPLTDILINPQDKAMYFTIGGRRTQSGLYRVTWDGKETSAASKVVDSDEGTADLRSLRHELEEYHSSIESRSAKSDPLDAIWKNLAHTDRHIRYAARIALEHLPDDKWATRAIEETQSDIAIGAALALARAGGESNKEQIVESMIRQANKQLSDRQFVDLLRTLGVTFARYGHPDDDQRSRLQNILSKRMPATSRALNHELARMLVYLGSDQIVAQAVKAMAASVTQEDLLTYGMLLRVAEHGWTDDLRRVYFEQLNRIENGAATADFVGGGHLQIYTQRFRQTAVEALSDAQREMLDEVINAELASTVPTGSPTPRPFVRNWQAEDLVPHLARISGARSYENGKAMFTVASCIQCHRFNSVGGILGPDITASAQRYNRQVMVREILDPSAQISDQFLTHRILTADGKIHEGRIVNQNETHMTVAADPKRPSSVLEIAIDDVEHKSPSSISMMPKDLLNTLLLDDILDLMAFIESAGNPEHANFQKL